MVVKENPSNKIPQEMGESYLARLKSNFATLEARMATGYISSEEINEFSDTVRHLSNWFRVNRGIGTPEYQARLSRICERA